MSRPYTLLEPFGEKMLNEVHRHRRHRRPGEAGVHCQGEDQEGHAIDCQGWEESSLVDKCREGRHVAGLIFAAQKSGRENPCWFLPASSSRCRPPLADRRGRSRVPRLLRNSVPGPERSSVTNVWPARTPLDQSDPYPLRPESLQAPLAQPVRDSPRT